MDSTQPLQPRIEPDRAAAARFPALSRRYWNKAACLAITLLIAGCSRRNDGGNKFTHGTEFFPMHAGERWTYVWENQRGDRWSGSMVVERTEKQSEGVVAYVLDSTFIDFNPKLTHSAYRRSARGLEHLYRLTVEGDCTVCQPARLVLPQALKRGEPLSDRYQSITYNRLGAVKQRATTNQSFRLLDRESISSRYGNWSDAILVENIRTVQSENAIPVVARHRIHYARDTGPVQIVESTDGAATPAAGFVTGLLKTHISP